MNKQLFQQKIKAFGWHLLFSIAIAVLSVLLVYWVWYPSPLATAVGVSQLYLMMLVIDMILGPILTFIVYKKPKKTLIFDLTVILVVQIAALMYGLYSMYQGKPAWIAYDVDRFQLVRVNDIDERKLDQAMSEYKHVPVGRPKYVASIVPKTNIELSNEILFDEIQYGIAPPQRPELYQPLPKAYIQISKRAKPLSDLNTYNDKNEVKRILNLYPNADSFVPLKANAQDMTVLIDKKSGGKVVKIVDLRPWQ